MLPERAPLVHVDEDLAEGAVRVLAVRR